MEKDTILVLKDFESIYSSLYDLFNQNFMVINKKKENEKKYARIAIGSRTNSFCEVHKKFRCIIIVDQNKIPEQEIPFLNRFEKQNISFEYIMNEKQKSIAYNIYKKCSKIINYDENKMRLINYDINNLLINCGQEEIFGFVYMETQGKKEITKEDYEKIENNFISKLALLLPQDIILILVLNKDEWEDNEENKIFYNKLLNYYNSHIHNNIQSYLSNYENNKNKIVIYTFSNIIESINDEMNNNKLLKEIKENNIKQIRISSILNEFELETEIEEFLEDNNLKIFILNLIPYESTQIDYLKIIIENKETEYKHKNGEKLNKLFIFIIHLERINKKDLEDRYSKNWNIIKKKILIYSLSNLAGCDQIFIDDLKGKDRFDNEHKIITLEKIFNMKNEDLYQSFIDKEAIFTKNLNNILLYFEYAFHYNEEEKINKDEYIKKIIELFKEDKYLVKLLDEKIMENIRNKEDYNNKNILEKIIKEEKFSRGDICIYDIVEKILKNNYTNDFEILYTELEKNYRNIFFQV